MTYVDGLPIVDRWPVQYCQQASSAYTYSPSPQFAYNSAKAANTHLTKMLATELARRKIPVRVNALAPGVFESEMTRDLLQEKGVHGVAQGMQPVPMGRVGRWVSWWQWVVV